MAEMISLPISESGPTRAVPKGASTKRFLGTHPGWMMSLFFVGFGMKLLVIRHADYPLPFWDQWNGEAADTYLPYLVHQLSLSDLFRAHNEHRIFFTRILDLALLLLNGQWDARLQMVVNAALHCAIISGFGGLVASLLGPKSWPLIWLPLALALMLPFGWENTVWAFQSQFYFLLLFSLLGIWLLGTGEALSTRWRLGALCAAAALVTVGSGFLAAAAVGCMSMMEILKDRADWKRHWPTLAVCAVIVLAGLLLMVDVPDSHKSRAHSVGGFLISLGNYLAWPTGLRPWLAVLNLFPLAALGWFYFRSQEKRRPAELLILGIGFWVILQALAAAYARGADGKPPVWRYMDTACFILIANWFSILMLLGRYRERLRFAPLWYVGFAVWAVPCVMSLWLLSDRAWKVAIPIWDSRQEVRLETARAFMATDDETIFQREDPNLIPHPYVKFLVFLMRTPEIRRILPACVREPLKVIPNVGNDSAFTPNGWLLAKADPATEHGWGSYSGSGSGARGIFESAPIKISALPYLEIPVAGGLGESGLSLDLVELASGKTTAVSPKQVAGGRWLNVQVRAPVGDFKLVARDDSATGWFAFKEPREMGRLSYWSVKILAYWPGFLVAGFGFLILSLTGLLRSQQTNSPAIEKPGAING